MEQHFQDFSENRTTSRGIPKFLKISYREILFHLIFLPEFSVQLFAVRKFNNVRIFRKPSTGIFSQYFKCYGRLYQQMYEDLRRSSLYQNRPIRADFIITTAYLLRNSGLFPASVISQAFTLLNSIAVPVNIGKFCLRNLSTASFIEFSWKLTKLDSMATFWAKYPIETSFQSWVSSRISQKEKKLSKSGIKEKSEI